MTLQHSLSRVPRSTSIREHLLMDFSETEPLPFGHPHLCPGQEEVTWLSLPCSVSLLVTLALGHRHRELLGLLPFLAVCASLAGWRGRWRQTKGCVRNAGELHGIMGNVIYSLNAENLPFLPPRQQTNPCPVMTKSLPFYYFSIGFRCSVSVPCRLIWWLQSPVTLGTLI